MTGWVTRLFATKKDKPLSATFSDPVSTDNLTLVRVIAQDDNISVLIQPSINQP